MPKLSICIPVEPGYSPPLHLVQSLLAKPDADLEIIVAPYMDSCDAAVELHDIAARDPRLVILPSAPENISAANLWIGTVAAVTGEWLTLVRPGDMIEPDLADVLAYLDRALPGTDALGWNSFQIDASHPRDVAASIAIPRQHHITAMDKTPMLQAFFLWAGAHDTPTMPFGLFHGAIKRTLLETILANSGPLSWLTPLPQYEWSARVLMFSEQMALSYRPLSAVDFRPYQPLAIPSPLEGFPFNAGIGVTAAIADIQARLLTDLGSPWNGFGEDFIRACLIDCMKTHDRAAFDVKVAAYREALARCGDGRFAQAFAPEYNPMPRPDRRRGVQGQVLLADRFLGNAVTAQEFYAAANGVLSAIKVVTGKALTPREEQAFLDVG
ncbi:hypothetical protein ACU5AY_14275 [Rhizobium sp. PAMB 3174]